MTETNGSASLFIINVAIDNCQLQIARPPTLLRSRPSVFPTFAEAALNFSDEKETKFDGGLLRNPINFDSRFELTKMDPSLYNQVRNLKYDEISYPLLEADPRGGPPKYKLLMVTNRYDEHEADFAKDYLKIQELALREKQYNAIKEWMDEHIEDTYVSVNVENRACDFANNWVKE